MSFFGTITAVITHEVLQRTRNCRLTMHMRREKSTKLCMMTKACCRGLHLDSFDPELNGFRQRWLEEDMRVGIGEGAVGVVVASDVSPGPSRSKWYAEFVGGSSVGHMRPKCCPATKIGRLGGRATTCEAATYIIKAATAQARPAPSKNCNVFYA